MHWLGSANIDLHLLSRSSLDLTNLDAIAPLLAAEQPEVVVNATAYNLVDEAEHHPDLAFMINAAAPGWLARATTAIGARLVHVSTNYVFSGTADRPYREDDLPEPLESMAPASWPVNILCGPMRPGAGGGTSGFFGAPSLDAQAEQFRADHTPAGRACPGAAPRRCPGR